VLALVPHDLEVTPPEPSKAKASSSPQPDAS
jgi:hypothetical protein